MNPDYALTMARYNRWQNRNLVTAATEIGSEGRSQDRGAFFGTIERTFYHLYWADRIWMSRFTDIETPGGGIPQSTEFDGSWDDFRTARMALDERILAWAKTVPPDWFDNEISWYSGAMGKQMSKPAALLVMQVFNHQTHHRGQIHAMLTASGARPGDTDIPFMPEEYETA